MENAEKLSDGNPDVRAGRGDAGGGAIEGAGWGSQQPPASRSRGAAQPAREMRAL